MKMHKCLKLHTRVQTIGNTGKTNIAIVSPSKKIKIVNPKECKRVQNIYLDLLGEQTSAIALHPTMNLVALANAEQLYILDTTHKNIIQSIKTHDGAIESLLFLEKSPYLISGTRSGRVMQYRYEGRLHISRLCSFRRAAQNGVSALAANEKYLLSGNKNGTLIAVEYNSHARKFKFASSRERINAISFLDKEKILYANKEGSLFLADLNSETLLKEIDTHQREITKIIPLTKSDFTLLLSKSEKILLLDNRNFTIVKSHFLHFEKNIEDGLLIENDELLLIFEDRNLLKIELNNQESLANALEKNALFAAFELLEDNPILQQTPQALQAEKLYKKLYKNSFFKLLKSHNEAVLKEIERFHIFKNKQNDAKGLLLAFNNYQKLKDFIKEYKYTLAYALCERYPALKLTPEYLKMEEFYKKSFTEAQKQLLLNRTNRAKEILEPFATIHSKQAMIQLIRRQNREFLAFLKAVSKKEYAKVSQLLQTTPLFKEIPSYITLREEASAHIETIKRHINKAEITKAQALIEQYQHISFIKEELLALSMVAYDAQKLLNAYEEEDFVKCYEILDSNRALESMQLAQLLQKHWNTLIEKCEVYALEGNIKEIKELMGELLRIESRKNKIGDLLRLSFQVKISRETEKRKYKTAEHFIYFYIDIFGIDSELKHLMKSFEKRAGQKLAIMPQVQKYKERDAWQHSDIFIASHHP